MLYVIKKHQAFSLTELLIVIALIGMISLLVVPFMTSGNNQSQSKTRTKNTAHNVHEALLSFNGEKGLPPLNQGPVVILKDKLKAPLPTSTVVPEECKRNFNGVAVVNTEDGAAKFPSGEIVVGLSKQWDTTHRYGTQGEAGDLACIIPQNDTHNVEIVTLLRSGTVIEAPVVDAGSSGNQGGNVTLAAGDEATKTGLGSIDVNNAQQTTNGVIPEINNYDLQLTVQNTSLQPIGNATITGTRSGQTDGSGKIVFNALPLNADVTLTASAANYASKTISIKINPNALSQTIILNRDIHVGSLQSVEASSGASWFNLFSRVGTLARQIEGLIGFFGGSVITGNGNVFSQPFQTNVYTLADSNGNLIENVPIRDFMAGLTINGAPVNASFGEWLDQACRTSSLWSCQRFRAGYESGFPPGFFNNPDTLSYAFTYWVWGYTETYGRAPTGITYTNTKGDVFHVDALGFSPIKISLVGKDAQINGDDKFLFDLDGFERPAAPVIQTTGGLNTDEAWLVVDREHNGFYSINKLDGNDVFGDHLGKYKSGYEDLAELFKTHLKKDKDGKRYFTLKPMGFWAKLWIALTRLFGFNKAWNPDCDLKLLTRDRHIVDASQVLTKVYVDYWDVREFDKTHQNSIRQRAMVEYKNGKTAQSADQWFKAMIILTPVKS